MGHIRPYHFLPHTQSLLLESQLVHSLAPWGSNTHAHAHRYTHRKAHRKAQHGDAAQWQRAQERSTSSARPRSRTYVYVYTGTLTCR